MIEATGIGKQYKIMHEQQSYRSLREDLSQSARKLFIGRKHKTVETFWALKDINFNIHSGERVGIIGRNGAGKSTLLKILSRITEPTEGKVTINGRVASLLEVGTGFHPELSGRENIFLNGAILGMSRQEIRNKFEEIVAFAEVERFLDTAVKRYSSGMYVRLAFAVAAHLEPEILIVDEVLAVGDAQFQKKCLGKLNAVAGEGRTVLFVSHNMAAIQNLCNKCMYLENGKLLESGPTESVIRHYLSKSSTLMSTDLLSRTDREGNGMLRFSGVEIHDENDKKINSAYCGSTMIIRVYFDVSAGIPSGGLYISAGIDDNQGLRILFLSNELTGDTLEVKPGSNKYIDIKIDRLPLRQGRYKFSLFAKVREEIADWVQEAGYFDVEAGDFYNTGRIIPEGQSSLLIEHRFINGN